MLLPGESASSRGGFQIKNKPFTIQHRNNISKAVKKIFENATEEWKENRNKKLSEAHKNPSDEYRKSQRLLSLNRIKLNYGIVFPNYNPSACEIFKLFDEKHHTHGRYAVYGDGEYEILELGHFTDYINFELKIIIEVYDSTHFNRDGTLRKKDIIREREIKAHFPDHKFYWFYDYEMEKILEIILEKVKIK